MIDLFYMTTKSKMLFMVTSSVSLSADRFILHDNEKQNVVQGDIICVSSADRFISHELKSKMLFMVTSSVSLSADRFILHDNEKQNVVQGDIIFASVLP